MLFSVLWLCIKSRFLIRKSRFFNRKSRFFYWNRTWSSLRTHSAAARLMTSAAQLPSDPPRPLQHLRLCWPQYHIVKQLRLCLPERHCTRPPATVRPLVVYYKIIIFNAKSIILGTKSIIFNANQLLVRLPWHLIDRGQPFLDLFFGYKYSVFFSEMGLHRPENRQNKPVKTALFPNSSAKVGTSNCKLKPLKK